MSYFIRQAEMEELQKIEEIYARARRFMASTGNPDQWGSVYPPRTMIQNNISDEKLYVITENKVIRGVFYFAIEEDPTYAVIHDGAWHSGAPYGVIHRIAGDGSGGIVKAAVAFVKSRINYLRMDTYRDNKVMQHVLKKNGFKECGVIDVEENLPMIAFDCI